MGAERNQGTERKRVVVIGLDCAPPSLVFDRWAESLPHLSALRRRGLWGPLRSCMPPITVPAWTCMVSGRDAGELGIYGFRNRADGYDLQIATSRDVRVKRVWDRLGEHGHSVCSLFVPLTSPPTPVRGTMVSGFLHSGEGAYVFPPGRQNELEQRHGVLRADADSFRDGDLPRIVEEIRTMTEQHFAIARDHWIRDDPDFLMMVAMGPDRLHHALWHHLDPKHPRYVEGNPWEAEARAYYQALDAEVGGLVELAADATIMVVSDHGAHAMQGAIAINEWLIREGWLVLKERPTKPTPLREVVDWSRTRAWGEGGYYARVWLNVRGREPSGVIEPSDLPREREKLRRGLLDIVAGTTAQTPDELYRVVRGDPPDLFVVFGDLAYRSLGTVGHPDVMVATDGEDGCNHAWDGIFIMAGPNTSKRRIEPEIFDVGRTILGLFDVPPGDWRGRDWSQPK